MLAINLKQLLLCTALSIGLVACGGGGSTAPTPTPPPANKAPTVSSFTSQISTTSSLEVTFSWAVSDADNDALSCVLNPGNNVDSVNISDCKTTTTTTVTYPSAGDFTANLSVSDPKNASANQNISLTLTDNSNQLPAPVVTAGSNELVIFYNRPDANYSGWILHLWNNDSCDSYADFASGAGTDWTTGQAQTGVDPNYGAYWLLNLKGAHSDCANFIVHKGNDKDLGGIDQRADLTGARMIWTLSGISDLFTEATLFPSGVLIANTAAHWADTDTVFWDVNATDVSKIRIYSAATDDLAYDGDTGIAGDNFIEFIPQATNSANSLGMPRYSALATFDAASVDTNKAKQMLTGKLLAIAYHSDDSVAAATYVQTPRVLDALYTSGSNDADEATLGLIYSADNITANLWAPTAQQVSLKTYNAAKELQSTDTMTKDDATGIWSFTAAKASVDRLFYRYELVVYHQQNKRFETIWSTDPYSVSLSTNGMYSQFVNLNDADLKPIGWDEQVIPTVVNPEDTVIYEGHIRNFSVRDQSTSVANRGKYLAFTEQNSVPVQHLKSLAAAGLTYFQVLPSNDIASIGEDENTRVNLTDTVADLCAKNSSAPVCGKESGSATLLSVYQSYDPSSSDAQALAESLRGLDSYNWGYDPKHFNAPEGSYSSNPDGTARILEMRAMVQALHQMGLRTSLDVVYNHTNSSGLWDNSVLDKVVPGYYYRRDLTTGDVRNETCCQDTETEHKMMNKLMADSLVMWAKDYKFDAFRFDIMGSHSKDSITAARDAVQAIDPDSYFYGEGWSRSDQGYVQAGQYELAGTEVGTFNDRPRDIIRNASLFNSSASLNEQDIMRLGLAGTLQDYQLQDKSGNIKAGKNFSQSSYAKDPADIINYVSKHDGEALWDKLQYSLTSSMTTSDRVRAQNIAATMPLLSQGVPFLQAGGDLIRSKSMDRNSFDSGDWFNWVDFTKTSNNWNVGLPLAQDNKDAWSTIGGIIANNSTTVQSSDIAFAGDIFKEFLQIRHSSPLFRLTTAQDIYDRVGFHNTGTNQTKGLIVMSIDDGTGLADIDDNNDAIVVIINGSNQTQSHTILTATGFTLHSVQQASSDAVVKTASFTAGANSGTFTVPALTTAVFVKVQGASQGSGLAAGVTRDAPDVAPFGATTIYLRGTMNNWGNDGLTSTDSFSYDGNGVYSIDFTLIAGAQTFKIADDAWTTVNLGFNEVVIGANSIMVTDDGGNMSFTAPADGNYNFKLDASGATPVLTISSKSPSVDCTALADSSDAIPFNIAGGGQLYVKGSQSGWGADEIYRLHYKGNNKYQAVADFDGDFQFKLASDDGSWTTQLWAQAAGSTDIKGDNLEVGVSYPVAYNNAGTNNNQTSLSAGTYSVLLTLNEANPAQGFNVGTVIIQQCQP
ncbi:MAG: pullulanase [Gammaproteobacteria bacterium]|nr:MAG: pullulanase [Gammaproteobacteria bacterium]